MHRKPKTPEATAAAPISSDQQDVVTMTREESDTRSGDEVEDYVGELVDGERHGHGSGRWPDGKQYVGQWQNGNRHGQGMTTWKDGQQYVGEWHRDLATGKAILSQPNGSIYAGEFLDSQRHGLGMQTYPNGAAYTGEWKDNHPDGWGVIRTTDGRQTIGRLEINKRHGRGVQFFANGEEDDNNRIYWEEGELISQAEWFVKDNAQDFESEIRRLGIPLSDDCVLSKEERTYILAELAGDWILEVPGMFGLALLSIAYLHQKDVMQGDIYSRQAFSKVLAKDSKGIAAFCRKRKLSTLDSERLAQWAEWSRSSEKNAFEDCLKKRLLEQDNDEGRKDNSSIATQNAEN
jgi:hypothetical protein